MALDESTVRHVAKLARLKLTPDEAETFARQLSSVIDYMEQLNELDTEGIGPTAHALAISNVFREDVIRPGLPADAALVNAPDRHADFFGVPKVLDQEQA